MALCITFLLLLTFGCSATVQQLYRDAEAWSQAAHAPGRFVPQYRPVQEPARFQPRPVQWPARVQTPMQVQKPFLLSKQTFNEPLTWRYPEDPVKEVQLAIDEQRPLPVPASSVAVQCGENAARVEVKRDLLGIGQLIHPADLTLGGCAVTGEDTSAQVLIFVTELHKCGSTLTMTEDSLVYVFTLRYTPATLGSSPIVRTREVVFWVECHYQRNHDVSSDSVKPTWNPYASTKVAEELLYFSLRLMTDNWQLERPSKEYVLGENINFEASVVQFYHVPLRVFVDNCVATVIPNTNTVPRYAFIENRGCLVDTKLTGSRSQFIPRTMDDTLRFQIEAFRFHVGNTGSLYVTCLLKATTASAPIDYENKACSFSNGRWREASKKDQVCGCCDTDCGMRREPDPGFQWEQDISVGPLNIKEKLLD
ncbi:zona pellucida sperm-binding protein 3-like isoform X1 [Salvelinus fontinalis]|uniref:zona pellucida sperm-binding protein 3-like isoform X1 n=1 Tax=Salvelinus fontinalis TaxID=8038 RepID=UPI002486C68E|nr:zona pellucida sperm-binding protein 3-like isoform X1 [Salvelinus fontinalis]